MDMYQKREQRKNNKVSEENQGVRKSGINCLVSIYLNPIGIPFK